MSTTDNNEESPSMKIVIQGFKNAGKTALLYRLKHGEVETTYYSNSGVDTETVVIDGETVSGWDLGYRHKHRPLFRFNYYHTDGLIFIIDSRSEKSMDEVFDELNEFVFKEELLEGKVVMVLANKQDMEGAVGPHVIEAKLGKRMKIKNGISVFVMPCSVATNEGLDLAMTRFMRQVRFKKEGKLPTGLIPLAWETEDHEKWEAANHKAPKDASGGGVIHKMKKAVLKDPLKMVKAFLSR